MVNPGICVDTITVAHENADPQNRQDERARTKDNSRMQQMRCGFRRYAAAPPMPEVQKHLHGSQIERSGPRTITHVNARAM
jgi:hypothetical protein